MTVGLCVYRNDAEVLWGIEDLAATSVKRACGAPLRPTYELFSIFLASPKNMDSMQGL